MKTIVSLLVIALLTTANQSTSAQSLKELDAKDGFRSEKFGETILDTKKFQIIGGKEHGTATTIKIGESPTLFGFKFKELLYFFEDGKLRMVKGHIDAPEPSTALKNIAYQFTLQYGPPKYGEYPDPTAPGDVHYEYDWVGEHVWLEVMRTAGSPKDPDILFLVREMSPAEQKARQAPQDGL